MPLRLENNSAPFISSSSSTFIRFSYFKVFVTFPHSSPFSFGFSFYHGRKISPLNLFRYFISFLSVSSEISIKSIQKIWEFGQEKVLSLFILRFSLIFISIQSCLRARGVIEILCSVHFSLHISWFWLFFESLKLNYFYTQFTVISLDYEI